MTQELRVLMIEDSEDDALLLARELKRGDFDLQMERVDSAEAVTTAIIGRPWDLVLCDYSMPRFRGTDALSLIRATGLDVPFIFVSGTIQEDTAIEAMRAGAQDYLMKGNLKRLLPVVRRELAEAEVRRKRTQAERELRLRDVRIRAMHEINLAITSTLDLDGLLEILLEKIDLLLSYSAIAIQLYDKKSRTLQQATCRNLEEKDWKRNKRSHGLEIARIVFESSAPLIVRRLQFDSRLKTPEFYLTQGLVSYMGVPLIAKGETLGVLGFYTRESHEFDKEEIQFLNTLAGQVAVAIHNAQLYEEIKIQAAELEKANEVKSEFLSVMSHELRTPINVMMGYVELVQDGMLGEIKPEQNDALKKSLQQSRNLLNIVSDILQATDLRTRADRLEIASVSIRQITDYLKASFENCLEKELTLSWEVPRDLPVIKTDGNKLQAILNGLIDNAIKFTDTGTVRISARNLPALQQIEIQVTDTGKGIAQDKIPLIFDLFRQLDSSSTRRHGGIGLGLYLAKKHVQLLGGDLTVQSQLGKGSTFSVLLPVH